MERNEPGGSFPEVRAALDQARTDGRDETVIVRLGAADRAKPLDAAQTQQIGEALLKAVAERCGRKPKHTTVFQNLSSVLVQADPEFLLLLLEQPQVQGAALNRQAGRQIELIRPVRKSAAGPDGWVEASR